MSTRRKWGSAKVEVIRVHRLHPDWCSTEIALHLGLHSAYVRKAAAREGLTLPRKGYGGPRRRVAA